MNNAKNRYFQHSLGAERFLDEMEQLSNRSISYPPYNIVKRDDTNYAVEFAIAGFNREDITITQEKGYLVVTGTSAKTVDEKQVNYLYKGISSKSFDLKFKLLEDIKIRNAQLVNGILTVSLEHVVPDEEKPILIEVA